MREILFRGKRKDNGEWVEGTGVVYTGKETLIVKFNYYFEHYEVLPETVGQYTGLTDKNGKKIFEGDIVKVPVYFDCGCYPHTEIRTKVVKIPMFYTIAFDGDIEIIGNIHDNPELLKGGVDNG